MKREAMPLQSIIVDVPFMQWRLDVIGPINPFLASSIPTF